MSRFEQSGENTQDPMRQLHVCPDPNCASELVYPLDWAEDGLRHYRILLRCPECEHVEEGIFPISQVEDFDNALDRGSSELLGELRRWVHANMKDEIETFAHALDADLINADDFRAR